MRLHRHRPQGACGSGDQRWYCKDCKRTFTVNVGRVLGMSKLPVEIWMTCVEAFIDQLLRDCKDKCGAVHAPTDH